MKKIYFSIIVLFQLCIPSCTNDLFENLEESAQSILENQELLGLKEEDVLLLLGKISSSVSNLDIKEGGELRNASPKEVASIDPVKKNGKLAFYAINFSDDNGYIYYYLPIKRNSLLSDFLKMEVLI